MPKVTLIGEKNTYTLHVKGKVYDFKGEVPQEVPIEVAKVVSQKEKNGRSMFRIVNKNQRYVELNKNGQVTLLI